MGSASEDHEGKGRGMTVERKEMESGRGASIVTGHYCSAHTFPFTFLPLSPSPYASHVSSMCTVKMPQNRFFTSLSPHVFASFSSQPELFWSSNRISVTETKQMKQFSELVGFHVQALHTHAALRKYTLASYGWNSSRHRTSDGLQRVKRATVLAWGDG